MIQNHTKDKGDLGLLSVIRDLELKGIKSCLPISEHLPFDLIAVSPEGRLSRISVKYKAARNGKIEIPMRSCYSNGKGSYAKVVDFNLIDAFAVYCPDTDKCYYLGRETVQAYQSAFSLRIAEPIQNQKIHKADDFLNVSVIWK